MKRFLLTACLLAGLCLGAAAESSAVKFLGIPVDGPESEFAAQLKSKGFTYYSGLYEGVFNGRDVTVSIVCNKGLVRRVCVNFPSTDSETDIRLQYNSLLRQFQANSKYMEFPVNETLDESEDISYELSVHDKRYQAIFYYFDPARFNPETRYKDAMQALLKGEPADGDVWFMISSSPGYYILLFYDNPRNEAHGEDL